nr:epoxide hydrolase N-terminal domain-containing protein [Micromonospora sp. DSM 115978]
MTSNGDDELGSAESREDDVRPFRFAVPDGDLTDLRQRLAAARWPRVAPVADWSQGVPLGWLRELCEYWRDGYDWRQCEARLDAAGQYVTTVDGLDLHFLHV